MRNALGVCGGLALAVFLVFGQTVQHDFVNFDDNLYVFHNPVVAQGLTGPGIAWAFTTRQAFNWHPVTWLSHMLDCQFYGPRSGGHHLSNVLLHAVNAILLFLVLRAMTGDFWPSALAAAVFAVHPLRVESVAWVAERKDLLSGLFFMLTLAAYLGYVRRPFSLLRYLTVAALFALGLMAKPMLVTLPFVLLLLDYWPLGRMTRVRSKTSPTGRRFPFPWRLLIEKIPLLLLVAVFCAVTQWAQQGAIISVDVIPIGARIGNALASYVAYVGQMFYPVDLAAFYPHSQTGLPIWKAIAAFLSLTVVLTAAVLLRRRLPYLFVGWFWYVGMLVPVIGLVQVGMHARADRYTYLPQIGLYVMVAWGAVQLVASWPYRRRVCGAISALVLAGLMGSAWQQTSYWHDSETLWTRTLACTSQNALAHYNLGMVLQERDESDAAIAQYRKSLDIQPGAVDTMNNLGAALASCGQIDAAIMQLRDVLNIQPDLIKVRSNLANLLASHGRFDEAIAEYQEVLKSDDDSWRTHSDIGMVLANRGRFNEAIAHCRKALALKPDYAEAHNNLGVALAGRGDVGEAIGQFRKAVELRPSYADARGNLGRVLWSQEQISKTLVRRRALLRSRPDDPVLLNDLAWVLATNPDPSVRNGAEAVKLAEQAVRLTAGRQAAMLDTLAAAYAETGRFSEAVEIARKAVVLATEQKASAMAQSINAKLSLYEANRPFHEPVSMPAQRPNQP